MVSKYDVAHPGAYVPYNREQDALIAVPYMAPTGCSPINYKGLLGLLSPTGAVTPIETRSRSAHQKVTGNQRNHPYAAKPRQFVSTPYVVD